jgi:hypothetical protein
MNRESDLHLDGAWLIFGVKTRFAKPAPRAQLPKDSTTTETRLRLECALGAFGW